LTILGSDPITGGPAEILPLCGLGELIHHR